MFNIEFSGLDGIGDKMKKSALEMVANNLYELIKAKVPEIEAEKDKLKFKEDGQNLVPDLTMLSTNLLEKLRDAGFLS